MKKTPEVLVIKKVSKSAVSHGTLTQRAESMNHTSIVDGLCPFLCTVGGNSKYFDGDIRVNSVTLGTGCLGLWQLLATDNLQIHLYSLHAVFTTNSLSIQTIISLK